MSTVWIVEDDPKIATLLEMTMKKAGHQVRRFADAEELDRQMQAEPYGIPDLLLLDLMLHAKSGYDVLQEWKASRRTHAVPVIILSARSAEMDKVRGLELGAEDYVTKPFGIRELQARVKTVLRRSNPVSGQLEAGPLRLNLSSREVFLEGERIELTSMEFDLLACLTRHAGETMNRQVLLKEVWGYASEEDSSRTVDSHIKTLRWKLGDDAGEPKYIRTVRGTGYRLIAGEMA